MTGVLATAALAPIQREPSIRSEQVSQLVLGEAALVRSSLGDWREIETLIDRYPGWIHRGYLRELSRDDADAWVAGAAWSDGAEIATGNSRIALPLRARVQRIEDVVQLPDGRDGTVAQGLVADLQFMRESAHRLRPDQWAIRKFTGAPYLWGGVTPWGVDCSGLVQSTWLARGITLPRDASAQAKQGTEVSRDQIAPGDLLFFADCDTPGQITHVGLAGDRETLVHATLRRGGFVIEQRSELAPLMQKLVVIRRLGF